MDSCSAPDSYRNRIWGERRTIESILVSVGSRKGNLAIAAIRLLRTLKRALHRHAPNFGEDISKLRSQT